MPVLVDCEDSHSAENLEVDFDAQVFDAANGEGAGIVPSGDSTGVAGAGEGGVGVDDVVDGVVALSEEFVEAFLSVLIVCACQHDQYSVVDDHAVVKVSVVLAGSEGYDRCWRLNL